jgi:general stress protein YciG
MNTLAGGIKYKETMIKRYGSEEAWKERMRLLGSKGGHNSTGHTFAHGKLDPSEMGKVGGRLSRRTKKNV